MTLTKESSYSPANSSRWDKLKPWPKVQEEIEQILEEPEKFDYSITLSHGPQLLHTMRHSNPIRCMLHYKTKNGEVFTTHGCHGSCSHVSVWTLAPENGVSFQRFEMPNIYSAMVFVTKHRVYMSFSELDMTIRIFTEPKSSCKEVGCRLSLTRVLCFVYNKEEDEVIAGGRGGIDRWRVVGAEHAAKLQTGRKFNVNISKDEWIYEVKIDYKHKYFLALSDNGIYIISYQLNKQIGFLPNWHGGSLTCCCQYKNEYILTGSADGSIMVWNGVVFNKVHEFHGHVGCITGLQAHHQEPFVVSSSYDGTVYVWRMDNFQKFMRVDLGEKIYTMFLLGEEELVCQTEREINIFTLNQFFTIFAPVESSVFHLCRIQGQSDQSSRILASTEDGSVRFFSPETGATITICYPMPSFQVLTCFAYNNVEDKLYTLLTGGDVLCVNCKVNPCNAIEILKPASSDEEIICLLSLKVRFGVKHEGEDIIILSGLRNGQISLLDAGGCTMKPVQAHKGRVECLEIINELADSGSEIEEFLKVFISGGSDYVLKFWGFFVDCRGHVFLNLIKQIDGFPTPLYIKSYNSKMAVVTANTPLILHVYNLESRLDGTKDFTLRVLLHSPDYDHADKITALDMNAVMGLFCTASKDGLVKIWASDNELIRELDFKYPIYSMCFANIRGDIIIGFQTNLVVVSIANYMMYQQLEEIITMEFEDDTREKAISYNHDAKPWFDPKSLPTFPTDVFKRHAIKNGGQNKPDSEQVLNVFKMIPSSVDLNDILITPTERPLGDLSRPTSQARRLSNIRYGYARALNLTIAEDAQVERIRRQSLKLSSTKASFVKQLSPGCRQSPLIAEEVGGRLTAEDLLIETLVFDEMNSQEKGKPATPEELAEVFDDIIMELMPWERELLKKDPIIAPDGFIPNSVIRKKLNYQVEPPPSKSPWRLKSAPEHDPRFLPDGWLDKKEESGIISKISSQRFKFVEEPDSPKIEVEEKISEKKLVEIREDKPVPIKLNKKTKVKKQKEKPKKFELRKHDIKRANLDLDVHKKKIQVVQDEETVVSPTTMMETFNEADETNASSESVTSLKEVDDSIPAALLELLNQPWFPECEHNTNAILTTLINLLASSDAEIVAHASKVVMELYHSMGLSQKYGDMLQSILLENLKSDNPEIVKTTLKMIRVLELRNPQLMTAVLPILLSDNSNLRGEAMLLVNTLAGVNCKDGLRQLMVDLGIIKSLDACKTEQEALDVLRKKLHGDTEELHSTRITDWVDSSVAGVYDNERKKMEKKTRQDSLVRRWSIKAKLKQAGPRASQLLHSDEEENDLDMLEVLRRNPYQVAEESLEVPPLPSIDLPAEKPAVEIEAAVEIVESGTDIPTRAPNVSRVSGYEEKTSITPVIDDTVREYYSSPSTLSDQFTYYSPSLDSYSDAGYSDYDEQPDESAVQLDIKDYLEKSEVTVTVKHTRRKQVKHFRPKLPNFFTDKKKKKFTNDSVQTKRKLKLPKNTLDVKLRKEKVPLEFGPSNRLREFAQLAQCIEEDPKFLDNMKVKDSEQQLKAVKSGEVKTISSDESQRQSFFVSKRRRLRFSICEADRRIKLKSSNQESRNVSGDGAVSKDRESRESSSKLSIREPLIQSTTPDKIQAHQRAVYESLPEAQRRQYELTDEEKAAMKQLLHQKMSGVFGISATIKHGHDSTEQDQAGVESQEYELLKEMLKRYEMGLETAEERVLIKQMLAQLKSTFNDGSAEMEEKEGKFKDYVILKEMLKKYEMGIETAEEEAILKQLFAQMKSSTNEGQASYERGHEREEEELKDYELLREILKRHEMGIKTKEEKAKLQQMLVQMKSAISEEAATVKHKQNDMKNEQDSIRYDGDTTVHEQDSITTVHEQDSIRYKGGTTVHEQDSIRYKGGTTVHEQDSITTVHEQDSIRYKGDTTVHEQDSIRYKGGTTVHEQDSIRYKGDTTVHEQDSITTVHEQDSIRYTKDTTVHEQDKESQEYELLKEMLKRHEMGIETAEEEAKLKEMIAQMMSAMDKVTTVHKVAATIEYEQKEPDVKSKNYELLKKLLKRQEMGIESAEDIELMKLFLEDSNTVLQEMAQEYLSRSIHHRGSDSIDVEFMDKALINRYTSITESIPERELIEKHMVDHEDSGINDSEAKQSYESLQRRYRVRNRSEVHLDEDYLQPRIYHQDSGIARDISDGSNFSIQQQPGTLGIKYEQVLSPLKSSTHRGATSPQTVSQRPDTGQRKWQPFLDTESASERKKLEMVRKDYEAGNMKTTALPPIRYVKDGPMVPGEAGLRLLHTVQFDKEKYSGERHRVQPMEARLSYHTQSQRSGQSDFGALKLRWSTQVPISNTNYQYHHQTTISTTHQHHSPDHRLQDECKDFQWDNPLPPAPPRTSRTLLHSADQFHKRYCKQYQLAKKKMHHYTSENVKKFCLPRIVNTRDISKRVTKNFNRNKTILQDLESKKEASSHVMDQRKLSGVYQNLSQQSKMGRNKFTQLLPISINQLIKNIKLKPIHLSES